MILDMLTTSILGVASLLLTHIAYTVHKRYLQKIATNENDLNQLRTYEETRMRLDRETFRIQSLFEQQLSEINNTCRKSPGVDCQYCEEPCRYKREGIR